MKALLANWLPTTGQMQGLPAAWTNLAHSIRQSPHWVRRRWLNLFGWPGLAGAGLLVICQIFYFSAIRPTQADLDAARQSANSIQERLNRVAHDHASGNLTPPEQLAEFYRAFPSDKQLLPLLEKIFKVAEDQGIKLDQGEYQMSGDKVGKLRRFQVILPIKSGYPQIRKFVDSLHAEIPTIAMEHLQFERQKVGDPVVDAKIKLALYLEHES